MEYRYIMEYREVIKFVMNEYTTLHDKSRRKRIQARMAVEALEILTGFDYYTLLKIANQEENDETDISN